MFSGPQANFRADGGWNDQSNSRGHETSYGGNAGNFPNLHANYPSKDVHYQKDSIDSVSASSLHSDLVGWDAHSLSSFGESSGEWYEQRPTRQQQRLGGTPGVQNFKHQSKQQSRLQQEVLAMNLQRTHMAMQLKQMELLQLQHMHAQEARIAHMWQEESEKIDRRHMGKGEQANWPEMGQWASYLNNARVVEQQEGQWLHLENIESAQERGSHWFDASSSSTSGCENWDYGIAHDRLGGHQALSGVQEEESDSETDIEEDALLLATIAAAMPDRWLNDEGHQPWPKQAAKNSPPKGHTKKAPVNLPVTFSPVYMKQSATEPKSQKEDSSRVKSTATVKETQTLATNGQMLPLHIEEEWPPDTTSVMLRNIPNRYTPEELLEEMMKKGFEGAFDFFYLPTDFGTKKNKGYGFLNLRTPELAIKFRDTFHQVRLMRYVTQKVLDMSPAATQGFAANAVKYLRHQASRVQNPWFKPMIFLPDTAGSIKEGADQQNGDVTKRWRCLPLTEENLPEPLRSYIAKDNQEKADTAAKRASQKVSGQQATPAAADVLQGATLSFPVAVGLVEDVQSTAPTATESFDGGAREILEDGGENACDSDDFRHGEIMEAAVKKFLGAGDDDEDQAPVTSAPNGKKRRGRGRRVTKKKDVDLPPEYVALVTS